MSLLNVPAVTKGAPAQVTLIKADVLALPEVQADSFWTQNSGENIKQVLVDYHSTLGGQSKTLVFNFADATPTDYIEFSAKSRSDFQIIKIMLIDFDGGSLVINRGKLLVTYPNLAASTGIAPAAAGGNSVTIYNTNPATQLFNSYNLSFAGDQLNLNAGDVISFRVTFAQSMYIEYIQFLPSSVSLTVKDQSNSTIFNGPLAEAFYFTGMAALAQPLQVNAGDYWDFEYVRNGSGNEVSGKNLSYYSVSNKLINGDIDSSTWSPGIRFGQSYYSASFTSVVPQLVGKTVKLTSLSYASASTSNFTAGETVNGITSDILFKYVNAFYIDWVLAQWNDPVAFWADANLYPTQKQYLLQNYPGIAAAVGQNYTNNMDYTMDMGYMDGMNSANMDMPDVNYSQTASLSQAATLLADQALPANYGYVQIQFAAKARTSFSFNSVTVPYSG
jgi:hypothetical protein